MKPELHDVNGPYVASAHLTGNVVQATSYAIPRGFHGTTALLRLDPPESSVVAVITQDPGTGAALVTALGSGCSLHIDGDLLDDPPTPDGGGWAEPVYSANIVLLYGKD